MNIDFSTFSDHELAVSIAVMDANWQDVMRDSEPGKRCFQCGHLRKPPTPDFVKEYVFERSRAREEQQRRLHGHSAGHYETGGFRFHAG